MSSPFVRTASAEAIKAYINLLCTAWDSDPVGTLPNNDEELQLLSQLSKQLWLPVKEKVMANFVAFGQDRLANKKLRQQYLELKSFCRKQSQNGRRGGAPRGNQNARINPETTQNQSKTSSASASASAYKDLKTKPAATPLVVPEWVPVEAWNAYVEMRGARHRITAKGAVLIFKKLLLWKEKGQDPRAVLEQSVMNGWTGIFELKESGNGRKSDDPNERVRQSLKNLGFDPTARPS